MAKKNIGKKVLAALTALGALCILVGAIALAFEANDSTLPEEPSPELLQEADVPVRPGDHKRPDRGMKHPSLSAKRDFAKASGVRPGLKDRDIHKHRPTIAPDLRNRDIGRRPDTSNLRMRRTSEMTPEEREQRRLERRERQQENLRRRIDSLSERIEEAKADGTRSEQQIERMERSMERMQERLQRLETDDYGAQRQPRHSGPTHSSSAGYHPGSPPQSDVARRYDDQEANQHYEREPSPTHYDETGAASGEGEENEEDE